MQLHLLYIISRTTIYPSQRTFLSASEEAILQSTAESVLTLATARDSDLLLIAPINTITLFVCGAILNTHEKREIVINILQFLDSRASGIVFQKAIAALRCLYAEYDRVGSENFTKVDWWVFLGEKGMLDFCICGI
jgi:hypothetical protein